MPTISTVRNSVPAPETRKRSLPERVEPFQNRVHGAYPPTEDTAHQRGNEKGQRTPGEKTDPGPRHTQQGFEGDHRIKEGDSEEGERSEPAGDGDGTRRRIGQKARHGGKKMIQRPLETGPHERNSVEGVLPVLLIEDAPVVQCGDREKKQAVLVESGTLQRTGQPGQRQQVTQIQRFGQNAATGHAILRGWSP